MTEARIVIQSKNVFSRNQVMEEPCEWRGYGIPGDFRGLRLETRDDNLLKVQEGREDTKTLLQMCGHPTQFAMGTLMRRRSAWLSSGRRNVVRPVACLHRRGET